MVLNSSDSVPSAGSELNIKLVIEYDGKKYFGWQRLKNNSPPASSIQEAIENSLQILFPKTKINLIGAGRTDAGVHALNQTANFKISSEQFYKSRNGDLGILVRSLNSILPGNISVKSARIVKKDFHSRYSAKKRIYRYYLSTVKRAYNADKYYYLKTKIDIDLAKEYCKFLEGLHSFKTMCKNKEDKHNFMSFIYYAKVKKQRDGVIVFDICANRFLHSMVRAIIGMMINIASGKISINEFKTKFKKGEQLRIQYVPSNALILYKIIY